MKNVFRRMPIRFLSGLAVMITLVCAFASSEAGAASTYETVGYFGGPFPPRSSEETWPESVQLGGAAGMAVNRTGAGGVAPGTVFVAVEDAKTPFGAELEGEGVARFGPEGEFEETFSVGHRCGPAVPGAPPCGNRVNEGAHAEDVDIDQTTGDIYFLHLAEAGHALIAVFSPDGSELISEFGILGAFGETASEGPEKVHSTSPGGLAVDDAGEVYVFDEDNPSDFLKRLMVFKPAIPGDFASYVYAGAASDIGRTFERKGESSVAPRAPMLDEAGHIYVAGEEFIAEFDLSKSRTAPVCEFKVGGGIASDAVDAETGEVFYYSSTDRKIHILNTCNSAGKFTETQPAFKRTANERGVLSALAFNPSEDVGIGGPPGALYAAAGLNVSGTGTGEKNQSSLGYIFARPPQLTPVVEGESVADVGVSTATLRAQINPKGSLARYTFEYLSMSAWEANVPADRFSGATEVPVGGATLGSGQIALTATTTVSGLTPGTEYHYRVIAENPDGSATGEDKVFRSFAAETATLPDSRAYEQVSPVQKNGGQVRPLAPPRASCGPECKPGLVGVRYPIEVGPDGEEIAYQSQPFRLNEGPTEFDEQISRRTGSGWQTTGLGPTSIRFGNSFASYAFASDLSRDLISIVNPSLVPEAPPGYENLFSQNVGSPSALGDPVLRSAPPDRTGENPDGLTPNGAFQLEFAGASDDLSRVVFAANDALTGPSPFAPAAPDPGARGRNLYEWSGGELHLVNVAPGNGAVVPGASVGARSLVQNEAANYTNAVSDDGSRIFWSDAAGQVYVRENAASTRVIPVAGTFVGASTDGSKVLLSSGKVYELETGATVDLTGGKGGFVGLAGQSDNFSHLYFVATTVLDEAPNAFGAKAQPGEFNLYSWDGGDAHFVATLEEEDGPEATGVGDWSPSPDNRTAEASASGRYLAFQSIAPLTDQNNIGPCTFHTATGEFIAGPCSEVYLFDSATGRLVCASCNPTEENPLGASYVPIAMSGEEGYLPPVRFLTENGRVFFDSRDSLVAGDTNDGVEDVYQYEPGNAGSCTAADGCTALISAGREPTDSNFLTTDSTGKNVFFTTRDRLVAKDKDDLIDLYDAREGGGISAEGELARAECQGEACQGQALAPSEPAAASSRIAGAEQPIKKKPPKKKHKHKKKKHPKKRKKKKSGKKSTKAGNGSGKNRKGAH